MSTALFSSSCLVPLVTRVESRRIPWIKTTSDSETSSSLNNERWRLRMEIPSPLLTFRARPERMRYSESDGCARASSVTQRPSYHSSKFSSLR